MVRVCGAIPVGFRGAIVYKTRSGEPCAIAVLAMGLLTLVCFGTGTGMDTEVTGSFTRLLKSFSRELFGLDCKSIADDVCNLGSA